MVDGLGLLLHSRFRALGFRVNAADYLSSPTMENQMEKNMENELESRRI